MANTKSLEVLHNKSVGGGNTSKVLNGSKRLPKDLISLILLTGNCCFSCIATQLTELNNADVLFDVQRTSGGLSLIGKERGKISFNLSML